MFRRTSFTHTLEEYPDIQLLSSTLSKSAFSFLLPFQDGVLFSIKGLKSGYSFLRNKFTKNGYAKI